MTKIQQEYVRWNEILTKGSFELSVALIAANWMVFGTIQRVLSNCWSKWSIILVVGNLAMSLLGTFTISLLLKRRWERAQDKPDDWRAEFEGAADTDQPWPFTTTIQGLGQVLRWCKVILPLSGGVFFFVGVLSA